MPAKYYSEGMFAEVDSVSGANMTDTILTGYSACQGCVIACGRVVTLEDGKKRKGPEYETIGGFGPNIMNSDLVEIVRLGEICDRYGMDTISASNTIGLAYMLYDKGIITSADTGGFELNWGDTQTAAKLLHMIGKREGIGDWLAQGSMRFGRRFGAEEEAVQVNGLEVAYHDPRGVSGMAISYATSPRGACHNQSDYFFVDWGHDRPEIGIKYLERHEEVGKGGNVAHHQDWRTIFNALTICIFAHVDPEQMAELVNAACGFHWDVKELMRFGERGWNLKRMINNRMGLDASADRLPKRLLEPFETGGSAGYSPDLQGMLYDYYSTRGWDMETGRPLPEKIKELELEDLDEQKIFPA
jgi:aldehyde:ferredoxin oxidoreductase